MDYDAILQQAHRAATAAIRAKFDAGDVEQPYNCGFAWVTIPGTSGLARHCRRKSGGADRDPGLAALYGSKGSSGWQWWCPGTWPSSADVGRTVYGQDMSFNYEAAKAFAAVLNEAIPGLYASRGSRLD